MTLLNKLNRVRKLEKLYRKPANTTTCLTIDGLEWWAVGPGKRKLLVPAPMSCEAWLGMVAAYKQQKAEKQEEDDKASNQEVSEK